MEKSIEKSTESFIIDDQDAGLFRVNRKAFIDPECLQAPARLRQVLALHRARIRGAARWRFPLAEPSGPSTDFSARRR